MFIRGKWQFLMAPADKGGAGGKNEKTPEEIEAEEAALEERIGKAIDQRLNKAISGHLARITPKLAETIGAQVLAGLKPQDDPDPAGDDKDKAKPPKGQNDEASAAIKRLEKQLADERKARLDTESKVKEAEQRRLLGEENDLITKALMSAGVKDETHIEAALLIHRGRGRVKRNEDGEVVYVPGKDADPVPLAKGIAEWAKTDEGKKFLPPTGAAGSGNRPTRTEGGGKSQGYSNAEFGADMAKAILGG